MTRKKVHKGNNNPPPVPEPIMQPVTSIQEIKENYPDCDGILLKGVRQKEVDFNDGFETPKFEKVLIFIIDTLLFYRAWMKRASIIISPLCCHA